MPVKLVQSFLVLLQQWPLGALFGKKGRSHWRTAQQYLWSLLTTRNSSQTQQTNVCKLLNLSSFYSFVWASLLVKGAIKKGPKQPGPTCLIVLLEYSSANLPVHLLSLTLIVRVDSKLILHISPGSFLKSEAILGQYPFLYFNYRTTGSSEAIPFRPITSDP